jgi:hypothetical protein
MRRVNEAAELRPRRPGGAVLPFVAGMTLAANLYRLRVLGPTQLPQRLERVQDWVRDTYGCGR